MKIRFKLVYLFLMVISCKSSSPFSTKTGKIETLKIIDNKFTLSDNFYEVIKNEDSLIYEVGLSLREKIDPILINRRLDSFMLGSYTKK